MAQSFYFLFGKQIKAGTRELDTAFGLTLGPHLLRSPEDLTCAGCLPPAGTPLPRSPLLFLPVTLDTVSFLPHFSPEPIKLSAQSSRLMHAWKLRQGFRTLGNCLHAGIPSPRRRSCRLAPLGPRRASSDFTGSGLLEVYPLGRSPRQVKTGLNTALTLPELVQEDEKKLSVIESHGALSPLASGQEWLRRADNLSSKEFTMLAQGTSFRPSFGGLQHFWVCLLFVCHLYFLFTTFYFIKIKHVWDTTIEFS